jgi:hypothetical protein
VPTALYIVVEDLFRAIIGKFDRELLALDVGDGAIAKMWMNYLVSGGAF